MCDVCSDDIKTIIDADVEEIVKPYFEKYEGHEEQFDSIRLKMYYQQSNAIAGFPEKMVIHSWESLIKTLESTAKHIESEQEQEENPKQKLKIGYMPATKSNAANFMSLEELLKEKQKQKAKAEIAAFQEAPKNVDIDAILAKLIDENPFKNAVETSEGEELLDPED